MKLKLFQVFYENNHPLSGGCEYIDARGVDVSPLFENQHILNVHSKLEGADLYGVTSWRMFDKTGLTKEDIDEFIAENSGKNTYLYGQYGDEFSLLKNRQHSSAIGIVWERLAQLNIFKNKELPKDTWINCFCNYWVADKKTWDRYIPYLQKVIEIFETDPVLNWIMNNITFPHRGKDYPLHPFVLEYLFGLFLEDNPDIKYATIPNKINNNHSGKRKTMKVHVHVAKTGGMSFIDMWGENHKTLCVYQTVKKDRFTMFDSSLKKEDMLDYIRSEGKTLEEVCLYAKNNDYEVIIGNLTMPEVDETLSKYFDVEYITFMRNPIDRAYSEFCHNVSKGIAQVIPEPFYEFHENSFTNQLGKDLSKFSFIGDFNNFSDDLIALGLNEIHDNKSKGKTLPYDEKMIQKYNEEDLKLYAYYLENKDQFRKGVRTLREIYENHKTPVGLGDKGTLHHYIENYDKLFTPYRHKPITVLEIGVNQGHSMRMWREYFPKANLIGIDIKKPDTNTTGYWFYICDQYNQEELRNLCKGEMFDIIIDDGSHVLEHQIFSQQVLWPRLNKGGLYIIEDIQDPEKDIPKIKEQCGDCEVLDTRKESGRYDDILMVWKK